MIVRYMHRFPEDMPSTVPVAVMGALQRRCDVQAQLKTVRNPRLDGTIIERVHLSVPSPHLAHIRR